MKKLKLVIVILCFSFGYSQSNETNKNSDVFTDAPEWARLMYSENPNVFEIDNLYYQYYQTRAYKKTAYTQYYKDWRRSVDPYLGNDGKVDYSKKAKLARATDKLRNDTAQKRLTGGNWTALGPFKNPKSGGVAASGAQANVLSIGQCAGTPSVMYCGTEPGEVYRSADGGNTWVNASKTLVTADHTETVIANIGIYALAVHPTDPNIVYIGSGKEVYKTTDGGNNWTFMDLNSGVFLNGYIINPAEIYISSTNPEIVLLAGKEGMYRTTNGGTNWNRILTSECFDIKAKPNNANILYTIRKNPNTNTHQFLISNDIGLTWTPQSNGWYTSTDPARTVTGARIAVSPADSNRVYAFLAGDSKSGDQNYVGLYQSIDGGLNWVNTRDHNGAPYTTTSPNLIISTIGGGFSNTFQQGTMNVAIMASSTNADEILTGGIGMYRSTNAGQTFECKYNYECSSLPLFHPDSQDYRAFGNEYWATTDGGIFKSNDFFNTNSEFKMDGVRAVDFWGFGSGWNRDILIGGTFHNGVDAYAEGFPSGEFLNLINGEPASGYVSPSNESRVYSNGMSSKYLPQTITEPVLNAPGSSSQFQVNETAWYADSSEMEFLPTCFNYIYKGYENKLFKSLDGGVSYTAKYTAPVGTRVLGIEISRRNTNKMYVIVQPPFPQSCFMVKTTDDWATSTVILLSGTKNHKAIISIDPENDQIVWLAYAQGGTNNLIYKSEDGGVNWANKTTSAIDLDGQTVQGIVTIGGTDGGVYVGTNRTVYYRNNTMTNWTVFNGNLPTATNTQALRPFYRDGKLRMATYGKGIWETLLYEQPTRPVAKIMVDKLTATSACNTTFNFDDYSMLNHTNATWAWTFQDGNIATSSIRNPQVSFTSSGDHLVTLKVTSANGVSSTDTITVNTTIDPNLVTANLNQNFEVNLLAQNWSQESDDNYYWTINDSVGGFGQSNKCMFINNFDISKPGKIADMIARVNTSAISAANSILTFDVAYSLYNNEYQDELQVHVSKNCGSSYAILYNKKGQQLATAPQTQQLFVPTATQWRKESIDLSAYIGFPEVIIKFRNINDYAQALYIDNIKLGTAPLNTQDFVLENLTVYPNPLPSTGSINVKGDDNGAIRFNLFSIDGKLIDTIFTNFNTPISLEKYNLNQGIYIYKIVSNDKIMNGKLVISIR